MYVMIIVMIVSDTQSAYSPPIRSDVSSSLSSSSSYVAGGVGLTTGRYTEGEPTTPMGHPSGIMEGHILARISLRAFFTKDWGPIYWVIKDGTLYLHRRQQDSEPGSRRPKKIIVITKHLRVLKLHEKDYKGFGRIYNFMLEEIKDYGPTNLVKFGR